MYLSVVRPLQLLDLGQESRVEGEAGALLVRRLLVALSKHEHKLILSLI